MKLKKSKYLADCKAFLEIAEEELEYIAWDIHGKHFDPACFWAHQVGEKSLKAYLFYLETGLIKKHELEDVLLSEILKLDKEAERLRMSCRFLDQFYTPVRYGGPEKPSGGFDKEAAKKAFESAKIIYNFVKEKIVC